MKPSKMKAMYRLTLEHKSFERLIFDRPGWVKAAIQRHDKKFDVAISTSLADQLKTAALPGENLSDTVLRVVPKKGA
jgi:hypothetical protein